MKKHLLWIASICSAFLLSGCLITSAVGLAADAVTTVGKVAVKTTGAVVDAAIPDGD